jgi:hypothetical protein
MDVVKDFDYYWNNPDVWKGYDKRLANYYYYRRSEYSELERLNYSMKECPYDTGNPSFYVRGYKEWGKNQQAIKDEVWFNRIK